MKKILILIAFLLIQLTICSQCIISCNPNIGVYSTNNASTIAYDNMGTSFHSTFVREPTGYRVWGEDVSNSGNTNLLNPLSINSTNYPALTGDIYHVGLGSYSIHNVQLIVLTSTGLFASGIPGEVVSTGILSTNTFAKLTVNGKTDGLPTGVSPNQVKMMFVSDWTIIITTCSGSVYVLSQNANIRGGLGSGSSTSWVQVVQANGSPLTNIIAARGSGEFAYALRADSTIWTWGDNIFLGNGSAMSSSNYAIQMTLPTGVSAVKMIQGTYQYTTAPISSYYLLSTDNKVFALGGNTYGQLGDNSTTNRLVWVNCKYPSGSIVDNAAWISANEHDNIYPNLSIINTNYQVYLCGINHTFMIGRATNTGTNYLNFPAGISSTDTITHCEVGGHTTAFIKYNTIRYGYVGHHINGSIGNGNATNSTLSGVDFITPPIINVCGTSCDTPKLSKKPYDCNTNQAIFYITAKAGGKVKYRINSGAIDSVFIGSNDSAIVVINSPTANINFQIINYSTVYLGCNLSLNIMDTVKPIKYSNLNISICNLQSYLWNGVYLSSSGSYLDTFTASNSCDSIVTLNLTVNPTKSSSFSATICSNQSYLWNGVNRTTAGAYLDTFMTSLGCDSIVTLNLVVNPIKNTTINATICSNQTYLFNGINLNTTGVYLDTLVTSLGCDSFLTLNLTVNPTKSSSFTATICLNQFYLWNGVNRTNSGAYLDTFIAANNCDSVVTLNLLVNPTKSSSFPITICSNQSYLWNGINRTTSGTYLDTFVASNGCDSVVTLNLTVNPIKFSSFPVSICSNQSYLWNGVNQTTSGAYLDTFLTSLGCDSIVTLNLVVNSIKNTTINATICSNQTYLFKGINQNTTGIYLDTLVTSLGCDSFLTLNLTVNPTKSSAFSATICSNQSYLWNGVNRTTSGAYLDTFIAANNCDSVVTLNLLVNPTKSSSFPITICSNQSYLWNGIYRTTSGTYLDTFTASNGCDSVVSLNLTVNPTKSSSFTATICSNQSYLWNGINRTTAGAYLDTFLTSFGCDSIVTLNLVVNPLQIAKQLTDTSPICEVYSKNLIGIPSGGTWSILSGGGSIIGNSYKSSNISTNTNVTVRYTLIGNTGCPTSYADTSFMVNYQDTAKQLTNLSSICETGTKSLAGSPTGGIWSIIFGGGSILGNIYTPANVSTITSVKTRYLLGSNGACPSTFSDTIFIVKPTSYGSISASICANKTYLFNGLNRNTTGVYLDTLVSSIGCDSILTLNLTVNPIPTSTMSQESTKCFKTATGKGYVTASLGKKPYTYLWSTSEISDSIINKPSGLYFVTVTDSNLCTIKDSVQIIEIDSIKLNFKKNDINCYGDSTGSVSVIAEGGAGVFTYLWNTGSTNDSIQNLKIGNYSLTVTDFNICSKTEGISLVQNNKLIANSNKIDSVSCFGGSDGKIKVNYQGGKKPYTYVWNLSPIVIDSILTNLSSKKYNLEIIDSLNCKIYDTIFVPEPKKIILSSIDKNIDCFGGSNGSIILTASGGNAGFLYSLGSGFSSTSNFNSLTSDIYIGKVIDKKGCMDSISITLTEPSEIKFNLEKFNSYCIESNNGKAVISKITGGYSPYTYLWGNGQTKDTSKNLPGKSWIRSTVVDNKLCSKIDSIFIDADYSLDISLSADSITCFGGNNGKAKTRVFNGFSPYTYLWNINANNTMDSVYGLKKGIYKVTVVDKNNCSKIDSISLEEPNKIEINFIKKNPSCYLKEDGNILAQVNGGYSPYSFIWNTVPVQNNAIAIQLTDDTYTVQVTDSKGCKTTKSEFLTQPSKDVSIKLIEQKNSSCFGFNDGKLSIKAIGGSPPYSYKWNTIPSKDTAIIQNLIANKYYKLTVADFNNCKDTASYYISEPPSIDLKLKNKKDITCFGFNDGIISINCQGGIKPYKFSFDNFKTQSSSFYYDQLLPGIYNLVVKDSNQCSANIKIDIIEPEELFLKIIPQVDTIDMCSNIQLKTILSTKSGKIPTDIVYEWLPNKGLTCSDCSGPITNTYSSLKYPLTVTYNQGLCKVKAESYIHVRVAEPIFIPKAFSPNDDGLNDSFIVYGNCIKAKNVMIYNRWGEKIYHEYGIEKGWDGKFKNVKVPIGVYSYIVYITFMNNEIKKFTGELLIVK